MNPYFIRVREEFELKTYDMQWNHRKTAVHV